MRAGFNPNHTDSLARPPCFETLETRCLFAVDLGGSLVAHWTFEPPQPNPAQVVDASPDGLDHPATLQDDAARVDTPTGNGVLQLDGSDDALSIANSADINLGIQTQRSVAFWFKADDVDLNTRKQVIYEEGSTTRGLAMYVFEGRLYVGGWNTPGSESGWAGTWLSTAGIESGQWHHAALVLDGTSTTTPNALSGYLDGQRFAQGEGSQLWQHTGSITVGDHGDGTRLHDGTLSGSFNAGFAGQLDDGRIYNRALQPHDVLTLARGPAIPPPLAELSTPMKIHELEFTLGPQSQVDLETAQSPERINAEQAPDFPGLATGSASPSVAGAWTDLLPLETINTWTALTQPAYLWPATSAWLAEQHAESDAPAELADVDPSADPLR